MPATRVIVLAALLLPASRVGRRVLSRIFLVYLKFSSMCCLCVEAYVGVLKKVYIRARLFQKRMANLTGRGRLVPVGV